MYFNIRHSLRIVLWTFILFIQRSVRGGKYNRFFDASRFSLERFRLNADKLITEKSTNVLFICWPAAAFCSPAEEHDRKVLSACRFSEQRTGFI